MTKTLTEQWREGTLEQRYYYVKLEQYYDMKTNREINIQVTVDKKV